MRDPRAEGLAKILVRYSTEVKEGDVVAIDGENAAAPLLLAVYEEVLRAGANPILNVSLEGQSVAYFKYASDAQLGWISPLAEWTVEQADVRIAIGASTNTRELSAVPPERQTRRQTATGELMAYLSAGWDLNQNINVLYIEAVHRLQRPDGQSVVVDQIAERTDAQPVEPPGQQHRQGGVGQPALEGIANHEMALAVGKGLQQQLVSLRNG